MSQTRLRGPSEESSLHSHLRNSYATGIEGRINLYQRFSDIKDKAQEWLKNLGKNGYDHSLRLESYLVSLTKGLIERDPILMSPQEVFVLLCGVYMHDVGYWYNGECIAKGHPERSREYILSDPAKYLLDDFPPFMGEHPRVAEAVGWVSYGHSEEKFLPLKEIPNNFPDQALSETPLNLRKLAALLRMADEADDPYIRVKGDGSQSIRAGMPLVRIGKETIAWHWKHSGVSEPDVFVEHLTEKSEILVSSVDYLRDLGAGNWYFVLDPQVSGTLPYMAEKPVVTFVGRGPDLKKLHAIISGKRAGEITGVTGTGGIGKTELAKMYAKAYRRQYPGGIFWASLKGSDWKSEAQRIFATIRRGADPMAFPDAKTAKEEVTKVLNRKGTLLIIDNVNEAHEIIEPECSVLVTTRNKGAFGILPKESIYPLKKFGKSEGLDFLKKVLGESRVNKDLQGASRLVEVLGGMPLAVEIAAKHLYDTPDIAFPHYIGWVRDKVEWLKLEDNPDKDVIASLTLSLELLGKEDCGNELLALFEAGSVCAEMGFTSLVLGSAAGIGAEDRMTLQQLVGKLHNRSLLEYSEESCRYTMHPLVRQISELRLKTDKERNQKYRENHCTYFLNYAKSHSDSPSDLIREKDGLWLSMVQSIQIGEWDGKLPVFLDCLSKPYRGYLADNKYETAFDYLLASNLISIGELGRSGQLVELLEPLSKGELRELSLARVLNSLGSAYLRMGEYRKAINFHRRSLDICLRNGDIRRAGDALGNIGTSYLELAEYRMAIEFYTKQLEIARQIKDMRGEGSALGNTGLAYMNLGEYRKAIRNFEQQIEISQRIGDAIGEGSALGNLGSVYMQLGKYKKAINHFERHFEIARQIGDVHGEGNTVGSMGSAYLQLGEYLKAIELYEQQLKIAQRIKDVRGEGNAFNGMGLAYRHLGEFSKALDFHERHLKIARKIEDVNGEGRALLNIGTVYSKVGDHRKAIEIYGQALEIARRIGDTRGEGNALSNMGVADSKVGEHRKAIEHLEQRLHIARRIGDTRGEGNVLLNLGLTYSDLKEDEKARKSFEAALNLFKSLDLTQMVNWVKQAAASKGIQI